MIDLNTVGIIIGTILATTTFLFAYVIMVIVGEDKMPFGAGFFSGMVFTIGIATVLLGIYN